MRWGFGVVEAHFPLYPIAIPSNSRFRNSSSSSSTTSTCCCSYNYLSLLKTPHTLLILPTNFNFDLRRKRRSYSTITCFSSSSCQQQPNNNNNNNNTYFHSIQHSSPSSFIVVNFYHFVFIDNPHHLVSTHLSFLQGLDIHGRIYLNHQVHSGPSLDALTYLHWIKQDSRFSDVFVQISPATNGHSFPRLKLRYIPSLLQLEGGISHLPLLDPSTRAIPLAPSEWRNRLQATNDIEKQKAIVLDVRNGYEWDVGHFCGAQRPDVDCFRSTSFGLPDSETFRRIYRLKPFNKCYRLGMLTYSDPLASVDKEKTDILMYCTGGIRCDIYSSILRQRGFQNLFTLKGGVSHYLQKEGPVEWVGNLFVFDSRLSLPPSSYNPEAMINGDKSHLSSEDSTFARCYICQSRLSELRHRNCANLDCNRLFLCCSKCVMEVRGCCCLDCTCAPRLRPILPRHQRYEKWHTYRDVDIQNDSVV